MRDRSTLPFLLPLFAVLATGIIVAAFFLHRNQQGYHRTEVERELAAIANLKANELSRWRKNHLEGAGIFYKNEAFSNLVRRCLAQPQDASLQEELRAWLDRLQVDGRYNQVVLFDAAGDKWGCLPIPRCGSLPLPSRRSAKRCVRGG